MNAPVSSPPSPDAGGSTQYLTFEIGPELFAIPILAVQEIRGWEKVSRMPNTHAHILGVINLRGTVVPVVDVRVRLGIEVRAATPTTVVIVVRIATAAGAYATVGCVVDAVSDVATIDGDAVRAAPDACGAIDSHFVSGVATVDRRLALLLDIGRLLELRSPVTGVAA